MAFAFCLSLSFLFLFIAHSTLLHFLTEEAAGQAIPMRKLVMPWPSRGRAVACLAIASAGAFAWFGAQVSAGGWSHFLSAYRILIVFVVMPLAYYGFFIARRLRKSGPASQQVLVFLPMPSTRQETMFPLYVAAFLYGVGMLFPG